MKKPECVIVDLDGTLFDSTELNKFIPKDKYDRDGWRNYNWNLHKVEINQIIALLAWILLCNRSIAAFFA